MPDAPLGKDDIPITKRGWNAFYGTELDLELRRRKITGIVLAGISTSIGVESAARAANERGYELTIVTDAVTDTSERAHLNSLQVIFPQIAEFATTEDVLTALELLELVGCRRGQPETPISPKQEMPTPRRGGRFLAQSRLSVRDEISARQPTPINGNSEGKVT